MNSTAIDPICRLSDPLIPQISRSSHYELFLTVVIGINALLAVLTSCSNALVIYTVIKTETLRTPANTLLLGLAFSDFGCGIITLPSLCASEYYELKRDVRNYCLADFIYISTSWPFGVNSFLALTTITADRFLAVHLHLRYKQIVTVKRCYLIMLLIFLASLTITFFRAFGSKNPIFLIFAVIIMTIYLLLNGFFIFKISCVIRRHSAQIHAQHQSTRQTINMPRYKKSVNTMYYVIGAFVLCYFPLGIKIAMEAGFVGYKPSPERLIFYRFSFSCLFINTVLNPVIYCWRIQEIRESCINLLRGVFCYS